MTTIPFFPYRLFFLYIEPVSALAAYLGDISLPSTIAPESLMPVLSTQTTMALLQLANLYLLFTLNEHLALSSTNNQGATGSKKNYTTLLFCLLVADFRHRYTMAPLGAEVFWRVQDWNATVWGSVGFVYMGATVRIAFLAGLGLGNDEKKRIE
ncbi:hypothetical protein C8J56DRAFT_970249 [Mycena floridula]|nr:hypothetical protein C8J56DRAFT_970249 [Mycena floridula]